MFAISCKAHHNSRGSVSSLWSAFLFSAIAIWLGMALPSRAQETIPAANPSEATAADLARQVAELREVVRELQLQVRELQGRSAAPPTSAVPLAVAAPTASETPQTPSTPQAPAGNVAPIASGPAVLDPLRGTTVNFLFDGYYAYNFNDPIGRVNPTARLRREQQRVQPESGGYRVGERGGPSRHRAPPEHFRAGP